MNEFWGLLTAPPATNVIWVWNLIRLLEFVVLVQFARLGSGLFQSRPQDRALDALSADDVSRGSWYLRAASSARLQMASGLPVTSASCMEPLERALAAPVILLRAFIGLFVLLGLLGTVYGLTAAVQSLQPTLQTAQQATELKEVIAALTHTLDGLGAAFRITLAGLLPTIVFSCGYGIYAWRLERRLSDVQVWLDTVALPRFRLNAVDADTQMAALLAETREYLENWIIQFTGIRDQMTKCVGFLWNMQSATEKLGDTADSLGAASESITLLMDKSVVLVTASDRMATLTGTIETLSANLTASSIGFETSLKAVDATFGNIRTDNLRAYQQMLDRNNELVASLNRTFDAWKKDQGLISSDLNMVMTGLEDATKGYFSVLAQTKTALLDAAGMQRLIDDSVSGMKRWHKLVEELNRSYMTVLDTQTLAARKGL